MAYIIKAPNTKHTGLTAGVAFVNGTGRVEKKAQTKWFEDRGYTIESEGKASDKPPTEKELLQQRAKELGIEFEDKTTSNQLKQLIANAEAGKEDGDSDNSGGQDGKE